MMWNSPPSRAPAPLASFKAGKMRTTPVENRLRVEAEEQRGLLQLEKGVDQATHLIWKDRQTLQTVFDLLVFPGDQTLAKVDTGRPGDRVYLLSFKDTSARRLFFWMQEPDASKDEERVANFNRIMNDSSSHVNPMRAAMLGGRIGATLNAQPSVGVEELSDILSGLGYANADAQEPQQQANAPESTSNEQVMEVENPSSDQAKESKPDEQRSRKEDDVVAPPVLTEEDLIRALEGPQLTPSLVNIVNGTALEALLQDADEDVKQTLIALLPEGRQTEEELMRTFHSPQLRQTLVQLSKALNSENINMVIQNFGLDARAGAHLLQIGDGIGAFLAALEDQVEREEQNL